MMLIRVVSIPSVLLLLALVFSPVFTSAQTASETITVNSGIKYQTMDGWETIPRGWEIDKANNKYDPTFATHADSVMKYLVNEVGIDRIQIPIQSGAENPTDYWSKFVSGQMSYTQWGPYSYQKINDNSDPNVVNLAGFQFSEFDFYVQNVLLPMKKYVEANGEKLYVALQVGDFGTSASSTLNLAQNPAEYAEFVLVHFDRMKNKYGIVPDALNVINEPENTGTPPQWTGVRIGQALVAVEARLRAAGYTNVNYIAPSVTNAGNAIPYTQAIGTVSGALSKLDTLAYHRYVLSDIAAIWNYAKANGLKTAMNEYYPANYLMLIDDLIKGNVSSWQKWSVAAKSTGNQQAPYILANFSSNPPTLSLAPEVAQMTPYMKFVRLGAVRIDAKSSVSSRTPVAFTNKNNTDVLIIRTNAGVGTKTVTINGLKPGTYGVRTVSYSSNIANLADVVVPASGSITLSVPEGFMTLFGKTGSVVTPPSSTKFVLGDRIQTTDILNVRATANTAGTLLGSQALGIQGSVVGGPVAQGGYNWWNINYDSGVDGWSVEDFLIKAVVTTPNVPPVANAGQDRSITLPTTSATPSGALGTDSDGTVASTVWSFVSGPSTPTITNGTTLTPTFSNLTTAGTYVFRLTVTDNKGVSAQDDMQVAVGGTVVTPPTPTGTQKTSFKLTGGVSGTQPFTTGLAFKKGDITGYPALNIPNSQVIVKSRWNDNSVKTAIASGEISLTAGTPKTIGVLNSTTAQGGTNMTAADIQAANPSASVKLGSIGTVSLSSLLGSPFRTWVSGPQMVEAHYRSNVGSDPSLSVWFYVRLYKGGDMWIRTVVENGYLDTSASTKTYVPTVMIGGNTVYDNSGSSLTHYPHARWTQEGWIGGDPKVIPALDTQYLTDAKLVPNYFAQTPSSAALNALYQNYAPTERGQWPAAMGGTGYAPQIGVLPLWDALYVTSDADSRAYKSVLANASAINSFATDWDDSNTKRAARPSDRPTWTVSGAGGGGATTVGAGTLTWDIAHHGSAGYLAYMITGDYFYLETLENLAALCYLMNTSSSVYDPSNGSGTNRLMKGQTRGVAWCNRTVGQLAAIGPTGDPVADDYRTLLANNVSYWNAESQKAGQNQLGYLYSYEIGAYGTGAVSPWQQAYWTSAYGHLSDLEPFSNMSTLNAVRDHLYKSAVGILGLGGAGNYCYTEASNYTITVAPTSNKDTTTWYDTWGEVYGATFDAPSSNCGSTLGGSSAGVPAEAAVGYWGKLMPAIAHAVDDGAPGASAAWTRLTNASNWSTVVNSGFDDIPHQGIIPRSGSIAVPPTPPPPPSSTKFIVGDRVQTTDVVNVRATANTAGTLLGAQALGIQGTVVGGPTAQGGYNWWNINYDSGVDGWSVEDFLVKAVVTTPNVPPVANAGQDRSITLPTTTAAPSGASATDSDGTVASTVWSFVSGPTTGTITNGTTLTPTFSNLTTAGTYVFRLTVADNKGATASDMMQVVVSGTVVTPPTGGGSLDTLAPWEWYEVPNSRVDTSGAMYQYPAGFHLGNSPHIRFFDESGATYDTTRDRMLVFGGGHGDYGGNEIMAFNIGTLSWSRINDPSPRFDTTGLIEKSGYYPDANGNPDLQQPRSRHSYWSPVYVPKTDQYCAITAFGTFPNGLGASHVDCFNFSNLKWSQKADAPNAGGMLTSTYDPSTGRVWVMGNRTSGGGYLAEWDASTDTWTKRSSSPSGVKEKSAPALDTKRRQLAFIGVGELRVFDLNQAGLLTTQLINLKGDTEILARERLGFAYDPVNDKYVAYSGVEAGGTKDIYVIDPATWTSTRVTLGGSKAPAVPASVDTGSWFNGIYGRLAYIPTENAFIFINNHVKDSVFFFKLSADGGTPAPIPTNLPPVTNAGVDRTTTLPATTATPSGASATDSDGTIASTVWSFVSGPSTPTITNGTTLTPTFSALGTAGTYVFRLTVTDNKGASAQDTMQVVVSGTVVVPPVTPPSSTKFIVGDRVQTTDVVNVRATANTAGTLLGAQALGIQGTVVGGPTAQGGYNWWNINYDSGVDGWSVEDFLIKAVVTPPTTNLPPVTNAGVDRTTTLPATTATPSGASATDSDGTIASTVWSFVSGPSTPTITNGTTLTPTFSALGTAGTYVFRLTVTDNKGASAQDTMQVVVKSITDGVTNEVDIGGRVRTTAKMTIRSLPSDGQILGYQKRGALGTVLEGPTNAEGGKWWKIDYDAGVDGWSLGSKLVTSVVPAPTTDIPNLPPSTNAGTDKALTLPTSSTGAVGSATDSDGTIASTVWSFVSGPSTPTITNGTTLTPTFSALSTAGTYVFRLTVSDNKGATTQDTMQVVVSGGVPPVITDPTNISPVVTAGIDKAITLPTSSFVPTASFVTDPDGSIASMVWTFRSGPATPMISGGTTLTPTVSNLIVAGTYIFRLTATDNKGATAFDEMQVIVTGTVADTTTSSLPDLTITSSAPSDLASYNNPGSISFTGTIRNSGLATTSGTAVIWASLEIAWNQTSCISPSAIIVKSIANVGTGLTPNGTRAVSGTLYAGDVNATYNLRNSSGTHCWRLSTNLPSGSVPEATLTNNTTPWRAFKVTGIPEVAGASFTPLMSSRAPFKLSLKLGDQNAEVKRLQEFLIKSGYLQEDSLTGYFGMKTQSALGSYQCNEGIVCGGDAASTGYGMLGPKTLQNINKKISY